MLEEKYQLTEEKYKVQSMENRIRRLEFEDYRARKMEENANRKVDNMMKARSRHYEDQIEKKNHLAYLKVLEAKRREKFQ